MRNWKTTIGGVFLAVGIAGTQVPGVPSEYAWIFSVLASAGALLLGSSAKDFDNHSTFKEVEKATKDA